MIAPFLLVTATAIQSTVLFDHPFSSKAVISQSVRETLISDADQTFVVETQSGLHVESLGGVVYATLLYQDWDTRIVLYKEEDSLNWYIRET